jgi:2-methylisocitrate lyase-like PEP mutase family enzyme
VAEALGAAAAEGVPDFVLNARTDAFVRAGDQDRREVLKEAVLRGRAYLETGAAVVFVPGLLDENEVEALVEAFGAGRLALIGAPGMPPASRLQQLGVARLSFGPYPQRVALTALQELVEAVDEGVPPGTRMLT